MNFDLKKFLKTVKLNEESISMVLGAIVIVIVGILVVNYFKDNKSQTLPEALTTQDQAIAANQHIVREGETLWSISEDKYGTGYNWSDIYKENKLTSEKLEVGQKLTLPDVSAKETVKPVTTTATQEVTSPKTAVTGSVYTVVKGDNLWDISVRAYGDGYQWVKVARENKLDNPDLIHPGNRLVLPR